MSRNEQDIDVSSLLTIDVESELRKLTQAQIQGPWQLPAELVRRALRQRANSVSVVLQRSRIIVEDDGAGVTRTTLEHLASLLDPGRDPGQRHAALAELERAGALSLLAIAGLGASSLQVMTPATEAGATGWLLEWSAGLPTPRGGWVRPFAPPAPTRTRVEVRGARLDRARARRWLEHVTRFARADITVDGKPIPRGFAEGLSSRSLSAPLVGELTIPREGDVARLWLTLDGVLTAHLTIPDAPCFEAAIETREMATPGSTAANLREAIAPHVPVILERAIAHLIELGQHAPSLPAKTRTRVCQLLLQAARKRVHASTIARLPLFHGIEVDGGERFFELLSLRQSVVEEGGERLLSALFPGQDPTAFASHGRTFILDESERSLLRELLDLQFRTPQRRELRGGALQRVGHALRSGLALRGADLRFALFELFGRKRPEVAEEALNGPERRCVEALRVLATEREIVLCEGSGAVRSGARRLILPRDNPMVRACVDVVSADPAWAYPALLALLEGRDYPARARRNWNVTVWSR